MGASKVIWAESASTDPNTLFSCQVQPRQTQTHFFLVRLCLERPKRHFCERFALASEREAKAKVSFGPLEAEPDKQKSEFGSVEAELGKRKACFGLSRLIRPKSASTHPTTLLTQRDICQGRCRTFEYSNRAEVGDIPKVCVLVP